jgi:uncharacterized protein (AIM24 family)
MHLSLLQLASATIQYNRSTSFTGGMLVSILEMRKECSSISSHFSGNGVTIVFCIASLKARTGKLDGLEIDNLRVPPCIS